MSRLIVVTMSILLVSCGGSLHPPAAGPGVMASMPHFLEVSSGTRVASLRFPAGTYSLVSADKIGYYYRAPRAVMQQSGDGLFARNGGIFVSKRDARKIRGYVYLAGGVTHVGNFSHLPHQFHD